TAGESVFMPDPVIELEAASKVFGDVAAVHDLNLSVAGGQVFGFIGPSGSGKTTTIRLLLGLYSPSEGRVRVMGADPRSFTTRQREQIGYAPQDFYLYPTLTAMENLNFCASLFGLSLRTRRRRAKAVLQFLELWDARDRLAR